METNNKEPIKVAKIIQTCGDQHGTWERVLRIEHIFVTPEGLVIYVD